MILTLPSRHEHNVYLYYKIQYTFFGRKQNTEFNKLIHKTRSLQMTGELTHCSLVTPNGVGHLLSTLVQVMPCCLTAPSHCLNWCWLIISEVSCHSPEGNFIRNVQKIFPWYEFENEQFKITATSHKDQRQILYYWEIYSSWGIISRGQPM